MLAHVKVFKGGGGTYTALYQVGAAVQFGTVPEVLAAIDSARSLVAASYLPALDKLALVVQDSRPRWPVFTESNAKLPFWTFSSLPGATCPGAGDCLAWCYSFKSWRNPDAWGRQAQNTALLRTEAGRARIRSELLRVADLGAFGADFVLRLYVDGDFGSTADVDFWMSLLREVPTCQAYGYSKSFAELLAYDARGIGWPANYLLNGSSGHRHGAGLLDQVRALLCYRGDFGALKVPKGATPAQVRDAAGGKAFVCPGHCGDCTPKGHACGSMRFKNIPVVIAIH